MKNPTEDEIRERCQEIQANWDEQTRNQRLVDKRLRSDYVSEWEVPEILLRDNLSVSIEDILLEYDGE